MRVSLLVPLAVVSATGCAGTRPGRSPDDPRFPFLAAVVQPARDYAPRRPGGEPMRVLPIATEATFRVFTLTGNPTLTAVGLAGGPVIRATRVVVNGSPVPGPPRDTLVWIVSPYLLGFRNAVRGRWGVPGPDPQPSPAAVLGPPVPTPEGPGPPVRGSTGRSVRRPQGPADGGGGGCEPLS